MDIFYNTYETAAGNLTLMEKQGGIFRVLFGSAEVAGEKRHTPLLRRAATQLAEYARGERREFDLPLMLEGTAFQLSVWAALTTIPYGQTATYGQIAQIVGSPAACRAVGMANNKNPLPIIVPCHRVIGTNGSLTGYAGGLELKRRLLDMERGSV